MKRLLLLMSLTLCTTLIFGQTKRMNQADLGRTYAAQSQYRSVLPLLIEAERRYRALDFDGTVIALENAVAQNPYSTEALVMRAKFRKTFGMTSLAEEDIRMANQINPLAAHIFGYYGPKSLTNVLAFEPEKAMAELSTFQKLDYYYQTLDQLTLDEAINNDQLVEIEKAIENIENDRLSEALTTVQKLLSQHPDLAIAHDLKGVILKKEGKFDQSMNAFEKATELAPDYAISWYNYALVQQSLGQYKKAKANLDKAIELQENLSKAYFDRAKLMKKLGEREEALADYNKVIDLKGQSHQEALINRGLTKKLMGDYAGALTDLNQAVSGDPRNAELLKNRGNLYLLLGLSRKAVDDYTSAIRIDNGYGEAYYNRAMAHFILLDKVSGCFDLEKSLSLGYEQAKSAVEYFCGQY